MNFEEIKGGAITKKDRMVESATPARPDYSTILKNASVAEFHGDPTLYYRSALDLIPKNIIPYSAYEPLLQARSEVFLKDSLMQGMSGLGMKGDPSHIQAGVWHSLKEHPKLLNMYIRSKA